MWERRYHHIGISIRARRCRLGDDARSGVPTPKFHKATNPSALQD